MEWKEIGKLLPVQPCDDLQHDVLSDIYDSGSLGESLILYHRESVEVVEPLKRTMTPEDHVQRERSRKRRWGAQCTCSNCGEEFVAGYTKGGIVLTEGEDGQVYDGWVQDGEEGTITIHDGNDVCCPICWSSGTVTPRKELRSGRTNRILQAEVVRAEAYMAVMYWMVSRYQDSTGLDHVQFLPHQALAIDRNGKLRRFRAKRLGGEVRNIRWEPCRYTCDPMQQPYYSHDAEYGRQVGGWTCTYGPELTGTTGEKTAIDEYIRAGGCWPGAYLHIWKKHPQVENLMRQGFAKAVRGEIDKKLDGAGYRGDLCDAPAITWVKWREVKPHRMLEMSREAFRAIRAKEWSAEDARVWALWRAVMADTDAMDYEMCREKVGNKDVRALLEMKQAGWNAFDPVRVVRYLEKKDLLQDGVRHLIDYRIMLRDGQLAETYESLWPRDLLAAHDRVAEMLAFTMGISDTGNFAVTRVKLNGLEWTDGRLCIVIPKTEKELKDEGRILRHCVGTYGKSHCSGKPIFFVRHYRRPERSYYTLNIDMTGREPKRVQLHGYGNERHGENKEHKHTIPKEVLAFCDRWEREVLMPWWREKRRNAVNEMESACKKNDRKKKKGTTAA